jgi:hypothetical protein
MRPQFEGVEEQSRVQHVAAVGEDLMASDPDMSLCNVEDPEIKEWIKNRLVSATKHLNNALYAAFIENVSSPAYGAPSVYRNVLEELQIARRMRSLLYHPDVDLGANAEAQVRNLYFSNALPT